MPITETISPRQQSAVATFGNGVPAKGGKAPEGLRDKDLFQKYILDKESEAAAKDSESSAGQSVGHDSELHAQQGMLTARNPNAQQPDATPAKPKKGGGQPQGKYSKGKGLAEGNQESKPSSKANGSAAKGQRVSASMEITAKQPRFQPKPLSTNQGGKPVGQPAVPQAPERISSQPLAQAPAHPTGNRKALRAVQPANQDTKGGSVSPSSAEVAAKAFQKAGQSGSGQNQTSPEGQQQQYSPGQENLSQFLETIPQQTSQNPGEGTSFQQAASQAGANAQSAGMQSVYSGAVAQVAQQILRMQENGGTSRVTLDMPDGEKLLVRFNVRPGNGGVKVQFATKSRQLKEALEKSWESLRVDAAKRGVDLDTPEFEAIGEDAPQHQLSGQTAANLLK